MFYLSCVGCLSSDCLATCYTSEFFVDYFTSDFLDDCEAGAFWGDSGKLHSSTDSSFLGVNFAFSSSETLNSGDLGLSTDIVGLCASSVLFW